MKKRVRLSRESQVVSYAIIIAVVLMIYGVAMGIIWLIDFVAEWLK